MTQAEKPSTTRRALFAAAPAVALAPIAAQAAPDSDLVRLGREWELVHAEFSALCDETEAFEALAWGDDLKPQSIYRTDWAHDFAAGLPMLTKPETHYAPWHLERITAARDNNRRAFKKHGVNRKAYERCEEVLRGLKEWGRARSRALEENGVPARRNAIGALGRRLTKLEDAIEAAPATTVADLKVKAKLASTYFAPYVEGRDGYEEKLVWNLLNALEVA